MWIRILKVVAQVAVATGLADKAKGWVLDRVNGARDRVFNKLDALEEVMDIVDPLMDYTDPDEPA